MREVSSETRDAPPQRALKSASIVLNGRQSVIICTLRSLSSTGALLELPSVVGTPSEFEVCIGDTYRPARVVWRSKTNIGVTWTDLKRWAQR